MSGTAMKLVVVGAAGRMGQTLIRTIHAIEGAEVFAAVEREGSPFVGRDAGELAGLGPIGVAVTDKPQLELVSLAVRRLDLDEARQAGLPLDGFIGTGFPAARSRQKRRSRSRPLPVCDLLRV